VQKRTQIVGLKGGVTYSEPCK